MANTHITRYLTSVADYAMVGDVAVVADVALSHKEILVAYGSFTTFVDRAVNYHMLADSVSVANLHGRLLAIPAEVLRIGGNHATVIYLVVLTYTRTVKNARVRSDNAVVAYYNVGLYRYERAYGDVVAKTCIGMHTCQGAYIVCHNN